MPASYAGVREKREGIVRRGSGGGDCIFARIHKVEHFHLKAVEMPSAGEFLHRLL